MNNSEAIKILSDAITQITSYCNAVIRDRNDVFYNGRKVQNIAIEAFKRIGYNKVDIIDSVYFNFRHAGISHAITRTNKLPEVYAQGVQAIIDILKQEKENLLRKQREEQQYSNKQIQIWTLVCSAVAAVIALITLIFTIFK